jgi:autotransporter-associated beta strand protein
MPPPSLSQQPSLPALWRAGRVAAIVGWGLALALGSSAVGWQARPAHGAASSYPYDSWRDEFDGTTIQPGMWTFDVGTGSQYGLTGWGNNELQYYTDRSQNAVVSDGMLRITARAESYGGQAYTSARLKTAGLFSQAGGRFEIRAALPTGQGLWPAIWMLPASEAYGGWAASGEIDIMEARGQDPTRVAGTIHYGGSWPNNVWSETVRTLPVGQTIADFHTYALEWDISPTPALRWYVDDIQYAARTNWWSTGGAFPAPFDKPFSLLLNVAVGGNYVGAPNASTPFPGTMLVDYVRVSTAAPPAIVFNVASGTQAQAAAGYPTITAASSVTKSGAGVARLDAANAYAGPTLIQAGTLQIASGSGATLSAVQVSGSASLAVAPGVSARVAGLTIDRGGRVDVGAGKLTVTTGLSPVRASVMLAAGRGNGSWSTSVGIGSSAVKADLAAGRLRAVGYLDNGDGSITFGYTAPGDINLDGMIDVLDISGMLAAGVFGTGVNATWSQGDFNYDGFADVLDAADILSTSLYNKGRFATFSDSGEQLSAVAVAVPEPSMGALLGVGLLVCGLGCGWVRRPVLPRTKAWR